MVPTVLMLVVGLAGANWMLAPEDGVRSLRGAAALIVLWAVLTAWLRATLGSVRRRGEGGASVKAYGDRAVAMLVGPLGTYMIVGYSLQLWVALGGVIDPELRHRVLGLMASGVLLVLGNNLPKILTPLSFVSAADAVRIQAARRYLGTAMVLLALFMAGAFVFGTLEWAAHVRRWSAVTCVVAVLVAIVWMNLGASDPVKDHEQSI